MCEDDLGEMYAEMALGRLKEELAKNSCMEHIKTLPLE
jgi:hypothetical protein